jgi:hypothetical protein
MAEARERYVRVDRIVWAAALLTAVQCSDGLAADLNPDYLRCIDTHSTNYEWAACGHEELQRLEAALQDAWEKLHAMAVDKWGEALAALEVEQARWEAWKESSCAIYKEFGRESQVLDYPMCRAGIIADRTKELVGLVNEMERRR